MSAAQHEQAIGELVERLRRHPPDRYPVQHATARFHLGLVLTDAGRLEEAEAALAGAIRLFEGLGLGLEHAKALNALGAVLRLTGRAEEAAQAFTRALAGFEAAHARAEQGAAHFNLGLARRDLGRPDAAVSSFTRARELFDERGAGAHVAAALRELGAVALAAGDVATAERSLEEAVELADRARDTVGLGGAANALGLARLAAGRPAESLPALREALGAYPRTVRPAEHAMVQANLAAAYEQNGQPAHARLAARHALAVAGAAEPVHGQASAVLDRLDRGAGDVLEVVDDEPPDRWPALLRDEMTRWVDLPPGERRAEAGAWIDGQVAREAVAPDLAEAWVGALFELPPDSLETVLTATLEALGERDADAQRSFRSTVSSAAARFHVPQLMRLTDTLNRIAAQLGQEPSWR